MKKHRVFLIGLLCAIAMSASAQVSTLPDGFESNVSRPVRTKVAEPPYTGIADVKPEQLTSEEQCRRFVGEIFYRIGECSELKIIDNQLRLVPLSDSKYVFRGTIVVPDRIQNGYFGTDSLLLTAMNPTDAEEIRHALSNYKINVDFPSLDKKRTALDSKLKIREKDQAELKQMVKLRDSLKLRVKKINRRYTYEEWKADGFIGLPNYRDVQQYPVKKFEWVLNRSSYQERAKSSLEWALKWAEIAISSRMVHVDEEELQHQIAQQDIEEKAVEPYREFYDFIQRYYAEYNAKYSSPIKLVDKKHPYGNRFVTLQDSLGGIHYVQASLIKDQFVAAKYYDRIRNAFAGKNICFLGDGYTSSVTDTYSGKSIPIETSCFNADASRSKKHLYLCKDIVVHGKQPTLCAVLEKGETRFLVSIRRHLYGIDEEKFIYKYGVQLQDKQTLLPESVFDAEVQSLMQAEQAKQAKMQADENAWKAAEEHRKAELIRRFGAEAGAKIAQGRVALGMSKAMCQEAWGSPTYRQQAKTLTGTSEIWYYAWTDRRLVFANDKLVEIFE